MWLFSAAKIVFWLINKSELYIWSRFVSDGLRQSCNSFIRVNAGCLRSNCYNVRHSQLVREFNPSPFDKHRQFSPFSSQYIARPHSLFRIQRHYAAFASTERKSRKMLMYLTALVFVMVGCSYAAVPLYRRFCQATGYGGTVQRREVCIYIYLLCN